MCLLGEKKVDRASERKKKRTKKAGQTGMAGKQNLHTNAEKKLRSGH